MVNLLTKTTEPYHNKDTKCSVIQKKILRNLNFLFPTNIIPGHFDLYDFPDSQQVIFSLHHCQNISFLFVAPIVAMWQKTVVSVVSFHFLKINMQFTSPFTVYKIMHIITTS